MNLNVLNYRYAEEVLNSKYTLKKEIEDILKTIEIPEWGISRPDLNKQLENKLTKIGWNSQEPIFGNTGYRDTRLDFIRTE
jgi:sulfopyruvate decarboxylase TPP-binding subunit